jgi:hypothetical protein
MSKTLVANTNLTTAPANSVKANTSGSVSQPTDLVISTNQVLANNGTLQGLTLGTNQFVGNTGSGLAAVTLIGGNGISLSTTSTTLSVNLIGSGVPTGAIMSFYLAAAPSGWRDCDGTTIANSGETAALFALIGATLPNLQGQFIRGLTTNLARTSLDPLSATRTLGSTQADTLKDHSHEYTRLTVIDTGNDSPDGNGKRWPSETSTTAGVKSPNDGGTETRPKNIALRYCIKL